MSLSRLLFVICAACTACLAAAPGSASLPVEIGGGGARRHVVHVDAFEGIPAAAVIAETVRRDLSGLDEFEVRGGAGDAGMAQAEAPDLKVSARIEQVQDQRIRARVRLHDVLDRRTGEIELLGKDGQAKGIAHAIADVIHERLLGERGAFSCRIAIVEKRGGRFELKLTDHDGDNAQTVLVSRKPIGSLAWSPDGSELAYLSLENGRAAVFVHRIATGERRRLLDVPGDVSAPDWSPDGQWIALALSKDGNTEIYRVEVRGKRMLRLTNHPSIDTEPRHSPDGRWIYFTSDRGGSPQIYRMEATGSEPQRITFSGAYSASPRPQPDGRPLVHLHRDDGQFRIGALELAPGGLSRILRTPLTPGPRDESPSVSPNGRHLLYVARARGRSELVQSTFQGRVVRRHALPAGDLVEAAWGPLAPGAAR